MEEQKIMNEITKISRKLPKFPDGRIDYSNAKTCLVMSIFLRYKDEIILLKRSDKVGSFKGKWNTVSGYLDEIKPLKEKILEEVREELGFGEGDISSINIGNEYRVTKIKKTWVLHPILIELNKKPEVKLDWEHTEFKWIKPEQIKDFDRVYGLEKSYENSSL